MTTRLTCVGNQIRLGANVFVPQGINVPIRQYLPGDMAIIKNMGANMARLVFDWYNELPLAKTDAYDPGAPGNFDPAVLAIFDAMIAECQSVGLWADLSCNGAGADFFVNPTVQAQFQVMWAFLAARYANYDYIMAYELISEPNTAGSVSSWDNALLSQIFTTTINTIRPIDPATPIILGPAKAYNIRNISQIVLPFPNLIYTFNFYEIGQGAHSGSPNGEYVKQAKVGDNPALWTTYPN